MLDIEQLSNVNGGTGNSTVTVALPLPSGRYDDICIRVYVNGELDRNKTVVLDSSVTVKKFTFTGSGIIEVRFKIDNEIYRVYTIDFENGTLS